MIEINNLKKSFKEKQLFDNYNLTIPDGCFLVITGKSGSGKSTLMHMIGGLESADSGSIVINGHSIDRIREREKLYCDTLGFLFQNYVLMENKTVKANLNVIAGKNLSGITMSQALEMVGLSGYENKKVYMLSGGEQQRLALARVLMKKCSILIADEPTSSVDSENAGIIIDILEKFNKQGKTVIAATHTPQLYGMATMKINLDDRL
ncbi:MAG: ATP-binding cassette domain-containing protein [Lachnospiraceae bacterium]|nr:ATP-binding cassette domain-containing protein [Lachnospiraceae bacterium]